jgi:phosphoglycerate kinase
MIKSIHDGDFSGLHVLIRADLNVPVKDGIITDDKRIVESLSTMDEIIDKGGIPILMSHLGRPKGKVKPEFSLKPVADYLHNKYGYNVHFANDCIGEQAREAVDNAQLGDIVVLENLRFHPEEESNSVEFAKEIAKLGEAYVNDAFGSAHRAHASTAAIAALFEERYAGNLMINELNYLSKALDDPKKPFVAVIGGAKISGKIDVVNNLFDKCSSILIGGGMMFTFYKAMGLEIGKSILEEDKIELAGQLIASAKEKGVDLVLPEDVVVADKFDNDSNFRTVGMNEIGPEEIGMDIGEKSREKYMEILKNARTVVWNGPMGVFEMENFAKGTLAVAEAMAEATKKGTMTIVGGGDSASAVRKMGFEEKVSHVSTGGGASLEYLEGKQLPGVVALNV